MGQEPVIHMENSINDTLLGAVTLSSFIVSLFFLRFWKTTKDRFFLFFSFSFMLDGISRLFLMGNAATEYEPYIYSIRLVGFLLILYAIYDKNRAAKR